MFRSRIISWAPKYCLSITWVALFLLKYQLFPSSFLTHPLILAFPSWILNLRQWQTPTRKQAILIAPCISIMEQLGMRALLSGPSLLSACCIPSVNGVRRGERKKEGGRGLWLGYHSNGINGCVGFKLALDDSGGLTVLLSVIGRFPPHYSVSFSPFPPSPCSCNLFLNLLPSLSEHPTHQSPPLFFTLWIQYFRQHDVQIKECDGSQWKYTAWCSKSTA